MSVSRPGKMLDDIMIVVGNLCQTYIVSLLEAGLLADELIELITLGVVAMEATEISTFGSNILHWVGNSHLEEAGLRTRGTLGTTEPELISYPLELGQIQQQVLCPSRGCKKALASYADFMRLL